MKPQMPEPQPTMSDESRKMLEAYEQKIRDLEKQLEAAKTAPARSPTKSLATPPTRPTLLSPAMSCSPKPLPSEEGKALDFEAEADSGPQETETQGADVDIIITPDGVKAGSF